MRFWKTKTKARKSIERKKSAGVCVAAVYMWRHTVQRHLLFPLLLFYLGNMSNPQCIVPSLILRFTWFSVKFSVFSIFQVNLLLFSNTSLLCLGSCDQCPPHIGNYFSNGMDFAPHYRIRRRPRFGLAIQIDLWIVDAFCIAHCLLILRWHERAIGCR